MTPESEVHHPHTHKIGHRLIDWAVPLSALAVSVISLIIGIHHGRTMQLRHRQRGRSRRSAKTGSASARRAT
jgi:hypothetical protein